MSELQNVEQAPTENLPADPAVVTPEVADPETVQEDSTDEPKAEKPEDEHQATIRRMERRIAKLTASKYQTAAQAEQAQRQAEEMRQRLAQYEQGTDQPQQQIRPEDVIALADRIAEAKAERQKVVGTVQSVLKEGRDLEGFDAACNAVNSEIPFYTQQGDPTPFLRVVLECDAPAKVLHYLGTHLDEAEELGSMTPTQAARRIARIEDRLGRVEEPKPTSAPKPIAPVSGAGGSGINKEPSAMSDREFAEWRRRQIAQRR